MDYIVKSYIFFYYSQFEYRHLTVRLFAVTVNKIPYTELALLDQST